MSALAIGISICVLTWVLTIGAFVLLYLTVFKKCKDKSEVVPCKGENVVVSDNSCIPKPGAHVEDLCQSYTDTGNMDLQPYKKSGLPHNIPTNFICRKEDYNERDDKWTVTHVTMKTRLNGERYIQYRDKGTLL